MALLADVDPVAQNLLDLALKWHVDRQHQVVAIVRRLDDLRRAMERDGRSGAERARKLLHCRIESQNLHEWYLEKILTAIEANRVADFAEHLQ